MSQRNTLPCPFCGCDAVKRNRHYLNDYQQTEQRYQIQCAECSNGTSDRYETVELAMAAWNSRPTAGEQRAAWIKYSNATSGPVSPATGMFPSSPEAPEPLAGSNSGAEDAEASPETSASEPFWWPTFSFRWYRPLRGDDMDMRLQQAFLDHQNPAAPLDWRDVPKFMED